eukprot:s1248_g4.t1
MQSPKEECQHAAICIEGTSRALVQSNTLQNNSGIGIQVQDSACPTLERNTVSAPNLPAIRFAGKSSGTIRNNVLTSKGNHVLVVSGDASPNIEKNTSGKKRPAIPLSDQAQGACTSETEGDVQTMLEERAKGLLNAEIGCDHPQDMMQDLDVIPLSRGQKVPGRRGEPPVTDVALRTPTKSFSQIKVLLKLRWLLRLHSACCELDYKMCSLRNIILGMQYVVLQECAEAECDSIFDTKVQQNVGAHLHLESVLDDIADQLYRSLGKAHRAFLEYVGSCDPMRSVHFSQIDSPLTPPQVQSNEQLAMAVDTIFVTNFLRQSQRETPCSLQELFDDMEALNLQLPEIPPLNGAQNLRAWALAKTKPTPESRQKGLGEDMVKLAQLDAVLLCAAIELHSPEVTATESELQDWKVLVNVPDTSSQFGGAPEPINFGSTGRKPGVSPTNAKINHMERPQLSPVIIDAVVHIMQHHFTFPEGIRTRLHRLLFEEYGLTTEQAQSVEIAATTNIDGKRLTEDVLWNIDQKEKARLRKYFVDTGKDTSHLLAPSLVPSPWMQGKLAKFSAVAQSIPGLDGSHGSVACALDVNLHVAFIKDRFQKVRIVGFLAKQRRRLAEGGAARGGWAARGEAVEMAAALGQMASLELAVELVAQVGGVVAASAPATVVLVATGPGLAVASTRNGLTMEVTKKIQLRKLQKRALLGNAIDLITLSAGINACEKGEQWHLALACLEHHHKLQLRPAAEWRLALQLLEEVKRRQLDPGRNIISFCAAISACEKGSAWPMALNLLELQGWRFPNQVGTKDPAVETDPDVAIVSAVMSACAAGSGSMADGAVLSACAVPAWCLALDLAEADGAVDVLSFNAAAWRSWTQAIAANRKVLRPGASDEMGMDDLPPMVILDKLPSEKQQAQRQFRSPGTDEKSGWRHLAEGKMLALNAQAIAQDARRTGGTTTVLLHLSQAFDVEVLARFQGCTTFQSAAGHRSTHVQPRAEAVKIHRILHEDATSIRRSLTLPALLVSQREITETDFSVFMFRLNHKSKSTGAHHPVATRAIHVVPLVPGMASKGAKGFPLGQGPDGFKGKGFPGKGMPGKGFPMQKGALPKGMGKGPPGQPGPQVPHPGMCKGGGPQGPHPGPCKGYGMAHPGGLTAPAPMAPMQPQPAPEIRPQASPSPAPADAVKASPAARRKTLGPLMPPLPPTALRPDSPVQAPEEFGGSPAAEGASGNQMPTAAADPVATVAPAAMPAKPSEPARPAPSMSAPAPPEPAPASTPACAPPPGAASAPAMPGMPGMPSMPSANGVSRREASRKTATQLRSELNRLREEMERQSAQGKTSSPDAADELKEELRRLQKQLEESERENQELRAKQSAPGESAPRRRGRKSMRNRTMDLTAHRNADWEEAGGTSAEESDVSDNGEDLDALLGLAKVR